MIEIKDCPKCGKPKERLDIIPIITDKLGEEVPEKLIEKVKYADIDFEISCKCKATRINVQYEFFDKEDIIKGILANDLNAPILLDNNTRTLRKDNNE